MAAQPLAAHPTTPCAAIRQFSAELRRTGARTLLCRYELRGDVAALRLTPPGAAQRTEGLWQHSCCEFFLMSGQGGAYREFNFAPSGAWAAYAFDAYRQGMQSAELPATPRIVVHSGADRWTLQAELTLPANAAIDRYALTAVIEDAQGALSYWALQHAAAQPDFHHAHGFLSLDH